VRGGVQWRSCPSDRCGCARSHGTAVNQDCCDFLMPFPGRAVQWCRTVRVTRVTKLASIASNAFTTSAIPFFAALIISLLASAIRRHTPQAEKVTD